MESLERQQRRVKESRYNRITLRFPGDLERLFQDEYLRNNLGQIRLTFLVGAVFYAAFGLLDLISAPAAAPAFWVLRFGIFLPVSILVFVLSLFPWGKRHAELMTTVWMVVAGMGILTMIAVIPHHTGRTYYAGLMMVLIAGYTWLRIRLVWAALAGWLLVLAYQWVAIGLVETPLVVVVSNNFFLVGSNVLCMLACHSIESYARRDFLKARLLHSEQKKVAETNERLSNANEELERLARIDGLTGIPNRREFDVNLDREWRRMAREKKPLALIMCDVDHFKQYNDTYGHQGGDDCLRKVAGALAGWARRPGDFAARYGGEEFAMLLADTDAKGAGYVAQMICDAVRRLEIPHASSSVAQHVTLSLGVCVVIPDPEANMQDLVEAADQALYSAKKKGRNRWELNRTLGGSEEAAAKE
jgi:diguanylate cyclase (GGDEF)-like protein